MTSFDRASVCLTSNNEWYRQVTCQIVSLKIYSLQQIKTKELLIIALEYNITVRYSSQESTHL